MIKTETIPSPNESKNVKFVVDLAQKNAKNNKKDQFVFEKNNELLWTFHGVEFLEKWLAGISNADIVKYGTEEGYIVHGQSPKDVANKIWELDKDMGEFLLKVIDYNHKKKKGRYWKNFSLTGWVNGKFYKNPRDYLKAIEGKIVKFKLTNYLHSDNWVSIPAHIPTQEDFTKWKWVSIKKDIKTAEDLKNIIKELKKNSANDYDKSYWESANHGKTWRWWGKWTGRESYPVRLLKN